MAPSQDDDAPHSDVARSWVTSSEPTGRANGERVGSWDPPPRPWVANAGVARSEEQATLPGVEPRPSAGLDWSALSEDKVTAPGLSPGEPLRRLHDDQVLQIAEGIRAETGASYQADPRGLAYRLGIDVVPGFRDAGERSTATEAVFEWHHDRRERGIRIYCALVRSFFLARRIAHGPGDVWALAIELVLPRHERWIGCLTLIFTQRFCPESVIRDHVP